MTGRRLERNNYTAQGLTLVRNLTRSAVIIQMRGLTKGILARTPAAADERESRRALELLRSLLDRDPSTNSAA